MKAAVVETPGDAPCYTDFPDPVPAAGQEVVDVRAAGVNHIDLTRASGGLGPVSPPFVVGTDGVGVLSSGRRVFFEASIAPYGSWATKSLAVSEDLLEPSDDVTDAVAAALGNTGLAAWLALSWRAELEAGERVLVLGAGGAVGSIAVQAARALGASTVVAVDRPGPSLDRCLAIGADAIVASDDLTEELKAASGGSGFDVIIDPVWGAPALAAIGAAARGARHIQIGHSASEVVELSAASIRAARLNLLGFSVFEAPRELRREAYRRLTESAARGEISVALETIPLSQAADAWARQKAGSPAKLVLES